MRVGLEGERAPTQGLAYEALRMAQSPWFRWRKMYDLPPTDPRFLDVEEDQVLCDLLAHAYYDREIARARNPAAAAVVELASDHDAQERMELRKVAFLRDPGTQAALAKLWGLTRGGNRRGRIVTTEGKP